ncbi:MAG: DUF3460 family protein [Pseudomonadota bacterium]|nr:DUF3460 family protein [Pseudomonadota bacterium]
MPLFWKAYKSETTSLIEALRLKRPALEDEQRRGRALLWDRHIDAAAAEENIESRVAQQPYVYQTRQR